MRVQPPVAHRWAGGIAVGVLIVGLVVLRPIELAISHGSFAVVVIEGLFGAGAAAAIAVRLARRCIDCTPEALVVRGLFVTRRIPRRAIVAVDEDWQGGGATAFFALRLILPAVRWRDSTGTVMFQPLWILSVAWNGAASPKWRQWRSESIDGIRLWASSRRRRAIWNKGPGSPRRR
jgi:hypothetical protein